MARFRLLVVLLGLLVAGALAYWAQGTARVGAQEPPSCSPDERQVQTFTGTQDQTTPPFDIRGNEWRFVANARTTTEASGNLNVDANNQAEPARPIPEAFVTLSASPGQTPSESSDILDGPGSFTLEIEANGVEYTIRVCERGGGGGQPKDQPTGAPKERPKSAPKEQPKGQPRQQPAPPPRPIPSPPEPSFKAGGPSQGPVPLMPNGRCLREFPVKQGGACWVAS